MLEDVFRDQWSRVLATLVGICGDIEFAEDATQEAFALAAERWPRDGEPDNPTAWLITTARNRAVDRIRRDQTLTRKPSNWGASCATSPRTPLTTPLRYLTNASNSSSRAVTRRSPSRRRSP